MWFIYFKTMLVEKFSTENLRFNNFFYQNVTRIEKSRTFAAEKRVI